MEPGGATLTDTALVDTLCCPEVDLDGVLPAAYTPALYAATGEGEVVDLVGVGVLRFRRPEANGLTALTTLFGGPCRHLCGKLGEYHEDGTLLLLAGEALIASRDCDACEVRAVKEPLVPKCIGGARPTVQLVMALSKSSCSMEKMLNL
jgi:hypothetical protein